MASMGQVLQQHNSKVLRPKEEEEEEGCNCRGGKVCPLDGKCLAASLVYGATVTRSDTGGTSTYTGLTANTFKKRYDGHTSTFRHRTGNSSTLSTHIWKLTDKDIPYSIAWAILARARAYNPTTGVCRLCLTEKFLIMFHRGTASLNSRREIFSSCRHRASLTLAS